MCVCLSCVCHIIVGCTSNKERFENHWSHTNMKACEILTEWQLHKICISVTDTPVVLPVYNWAVFVFQLQTPQSFSQSMTDMCLCFSYRHPSRSPRVWLSWVCVSVTDAPVVFPEYDWAVFVFQLQTPQSFSQSMTDMCLCFSYRHPSRSPKVWLSWVCVSVTDTPVVLPEYDWADAGPTEEQRSQQLDSTPATPGST